MGWSLGYDNQWNRWIGYGVPAYCDHPKCNKSIDRGLAYVCGNEPYGGERGCGLYFCEEHLGGANSLCQRCYAAEAAREAGEDDAEAIAFDPKPEHPEWIHHLMTDESWAEWRAKNPKEVAKLSAGAPREGER